MVGNERTFRHAPRVSCQTAVDLCLKNVMIHTKIPK